MSELWGWDAGVQQRNFDDAALRQAGLDARAAELKLKADETELKQNEAFRQAISDGSLEGRVLDEEDIPSALDFAGSAALQSGLVEKGKELVSAASTIRNQQSLQARRQAKTELEHLQTLANLYEPVTSQQEWDQANAQFQLITGEASPFANQPYTPEMLEGIRAATLSAKDRASMGLADTRRGLLESQIIESEKKQKLLDAQIDNTQTRTKNLEKAGVKPVPGTYTTAVKNKLLDEFEDIGIMPGQAAAAALPLAEQAYQLVQEDGLTLSQAVNRVVQEAIDSGELGGWTPMEAYKPGDRRDNPAPMPLTKAGVIDTSKLAKNKYYAPSPTMIAKLGLSPGSVILYTKAGKYLAVSPEDEDDADIGVDENEDEDLEE